jgi:hypothetical protein
MRGSQQSTGKGKPPVAAKPPAKSGNPRASAASVETSDELYGVISVLYHSLQGLETYERYLEDARNAEDEQLVSFFEQCMEEEKGRAKRAKSLLAARLEDAEGGDDDEASDEDDEEDEEE